MKPIPKRLYQSCAVIPRPVASSSSTHPVPRVRSSSVSSSRSLYTSTGPLFFDAPTPPPSRPGTHHIPSPARLPIEAKTEIELQFNPPHSTSPIQHSHAPHSHGQSSGPNPPFSLALTAPYANSSPSPSSPAFPHASFFPYSSFAPVPAYNPSASNEPESRSHAHRHTPRFYMDVGAYGIPKRQRPSKLPARHGQSSVPLYSSSAQTDYANLAVQVGEDAYFVRDNAMGVADGVGGWSRSKCKDVAVPTTSADLSPSALFARRLMHYCAEEIDAAAASSSTPSHTHSPTHSTRSPSPLTRPSPSPSLMSPLPRPVYDLEDTFPFDFEELNEELEDSLEELEDGLDVLNILESAYGAALKAHVISPNRVKVDEPPLGDVTATTTNSIGHTHIILPPSKFKAVPPSTLSETPSSQSAQSAEAVPLLTGSSTALLAVLDHSFAETSSTSGSGVPNPISISSVDPIDETLSQNRRGAVIKIAHLGDCMGMLVRGQEIVWRTEEMWSNFNTPLQLGPSSSTRPTDARVFTVPVEADDILILASDGLSDNLWDEEVLDEVVRFRRSFLDNTPKGSVHSRGLLGRKALAGMLSEALCSRARRVSERSRSSPLGDSSPDGKFKIDETPFARRAREEGRVFCGGKNDDISVLVALISPSPPTP
ncbi:hypothetical protein JAAARDRAFT_184148 [Jaapia argillacea MUCL 33604]|uniref:Protein phosphatase n=1 Tax=Jaapia argillacea MUCL 33604 TaxID=933084 RepID=A0A067PQG2_9AGAM|nr:hypothetical protein JAAARDRAFT_184148 [Jaapia argillacea MUCL 33604]